MPSRKPTILVSGGGIAGSAFAHWAVRHGFTPTVVERFPDVRSEGFRIEISAGGRRVLEHMGAVDLLDGETGPPPELEFRFGESAAPVRPPGVSVGDETVVGRTALVRALHTLRGPGTEYVFGDSVTALEETPDGVDVEFENGPARRFDLVVGADGLHSNVRRLVFGGTTADHARYLGTNLAIFSVPDLTGQRDLSSALVKPGRGAVLTTMPARDDLEAVLLHRSAAAPRSLTQDGIKAEMARVFADDGWEVPRILEAMRDAHVHFAPSQQVRMDVWSRGRVVLLGDAAFCPDPMSGMGAVLALKGAMALAGELARAGGDHRAGFFAYEAAMRPHVEHAQSLGGLAVSGVAPRGGALGFQAMRAGVRLLSLVSRLVSYAPRDDEPGFPLARQLPAADRDGGLEAA
ncbi:FAD-dependent monooxygenase [Nocardiopsis flavescens]